MKTERLPPALRSILQSNSLTALKAHEGSLRKGGVYGRKRKTLLHLACKYTTSREVVKYLVEVLGVNPHTKVFRKNVTCLHFACGKGALGIVKYLIKTCNCDPNLAGPYGMTPLYVAVRFDHYEVAEFLVRSGCDEKVTGKYNWNCAHWAAFRGNSDMIQLFPRNIWADLTSDKENVSDIAAKQGHTSFLQFLLSSAFPIDPVSLLLSSSGSEEVADWLFSAGFFAPLYILLKLNLPSRILFQRFSPSDLSLPLLIRYDRSDLFPIYMRERGKSYTDLSARFHFPPKIERLVCRELLWEQRRLLLWTYDSAKVAFGRIPVALLREIAEFL